MGSVGLGANIFRITQTEALLEKQTEPNEDIAKNTRKDIEEKLGESIITKDNSL